jgi:glycogen phosphorylase/synthase
MKPDYIFETSWEICNKIGGIYTVVSTKAKSIVNEYKDNYILIGPDVWKETRENHDFAEDESLFEEWKLKAREDGLKIRAGRWNIEGNPIVILIDFSGLYARKDELFARFWETYKLDSIQGAWDYVEPFLFGYMAGQVIRSYQEFYLDPADKVVAQFHEWMSGAGILYIENKLPQIGTVFTTHATVLGRSIAGRGLPLYSKLEEYIPEYTARDFQVTSKHSLELKAAEVADVFTTVSNITARECKHFLGRQPDVITTNGFEADFVPKEDQFNEKRKLARSKAFETAKTITGKNYTEDTMLLITSGRYEFKNKGIDLFIQSLGKLNKQESLQQDILAFVAIPADHRGPTDVFRGKEKRSNYLTHKISNFEHDAILNEIARQGITNQVNDKVHVIFIPAYLNGNDEVINLSYYDFLIGHDLSVFPSYYEPWGYTPLESVAFKIPTITTNVAGFGDWVKVNFNLETAAVSVIERKETGDDEAVNEISKIILNLNKAENSEQIIKDTQTVFKKSLWDSFVIKYYEAWELAIEKSLDHPRAMPVKTKVETQRLEIQLQHDRPLWKKILVQPALPKEHTPLKDLAYNLWWSWNHDAIELFESIADDRWYNLGYNPVKLLESLSLDEINQLSQDTEFKSRLDSVCKQFDTYMAESKNKPQELVAYFSMEYGLQVSLQIYSGGLGILAGDYLKQASDSNKNMVGIGLLYRHGYFTQTLSLLGDQIAEYKPQKFTQLPLVPLRDEQGNWIKIKIAFPGRNVTAKVWQVNVGRIILYLLDTDIEENNLEDRKITNILYGGDNEHRLKQEIILGIGGVRLIQTLGIKPDVYHLNEGHSAFSGLERIRSLMEREGIDFYHAVEVVRSSSLFTTHTPVPAGHDSFEEHLMRAYLVQFSDYFKISWEDFVGLGRYNIKNAAEKFSMSVLATKLSQEVNGVSKIHGKVAREMFQPLYPGYYSEELHIGHVTNGVHYFTWTDHVWQELYRNTFGDQFEHEQPNASLWESIHEVPDEIIWKNRLILKNKLIEDIKIKQKRDFTRRHESPKVMLKSMAHLTEETLIIGFARRFATYKRAHLLFANLERLSAIVNSDEKPVIFLFAGKAHPNDKAGQDLIKRIVEISKTPEFIGKIIFLEDYDMTGGKLLTNCVDIWLNTPTRPLEASGTSGEKAIMNGVLNFSVLDGWWAEGFKPGAGWAIEEQRTFDSQQFQDELDAEILYNTFEQEIIPVYYNMNEDDIPENWIRMIKNNIAGIAPHFTMQRMLEEYYTKFYSKLFETGKRMRSDGYIVARKLVEWKHKINKNWDNISVDSLTIPDTNSGPMDFGSEFDAEIILNLSELDINDIGVEIIMGNKTNGDVNEISFKKELDANGFKDGKATYSCKFPLQNAGVHDFAFRIFPKHPDLKYRMHFPIVKWV